MVAMVYSCGINYYPVCACVNNQCDSIMRIALGIEYDGSAYNGWQSQNHGHGVQEEVERAVTSVANDKVKVVCAGRTDTGVHALEQVVHFDTDAERSEYSWIFGSNANLPDNISILWAKPVSDDFHARYSAQRRQYRYVILNRSVRPALHSRYATWFYKPLDEDRMATAAQALVGTHDFTSYRTVHCQAKNPVREVSRLDVKRYNEFIYIDIEANAFLHHMVRNIAGVLMAIGTGEQAVTWAKEVLDFRDRTLGGVTAGANGLYFMRAQYPDVFQLPQANHAFTTI